MKSRFINHPLTSVSEIGLGCWQLGGADWGTIDDAEALKILRQALDSGITFFDTADVYGAGRSEELLGRFSKELPGSTGLEKGIFTATKLGRTQSLFPDHYSEEGIRWATEDSLRRLGVEALDLTQLHCVPKTTLKQGEIFEWLRRLQSEGKILRFGASVESDEEAEICLQQEGLSSLQIIFNIFRQKPAFHLLEEARRNSVAIIVRLPLASGVLTGKFTSTTQFGEKDHRHYNRDGASFNVGETFAGIPYDKAVELAEELKFLLPSGITMAAMAQRWILDHEAVTTVITGASRPEQVAANAAVSELPPLPRELGERLHTFYKESVAAHIRGPY